MPQYSLSDKLKRLYEAQDTLPKLIEDETFPEQRMEQYYVNLRIVLSTRSGEDSKEIKLSELFDKQDDQEATGRVLITGSAGMGKSTLLHYVLYQWGAGKLFQNKFDYVFGIKLKNLLSNGWDKRSGTKADPLAKFIYEGLFEGALELEHKRSSGEMNEISKDEVIRVFRDHAKDKALNKRTLLLLDGYDEIAHLRHNVVIQRILEEIWKYDNVVLTSRPNVLPQKIVDKFNRRVEATGLGEAAVRDYIDRYFKHQKSIVKSDEALADVTNREAKLLAAYDTTEALRETLAVPINTVIFCLVSADFNHQEGGALKEVSIGKLYQRAMIWLGKRYVAKKGEFERNDQALIKSVEFEVLSRIAYELFIDNRLSVEGVAIDNIAIESSKGAVRIGDVYRCGLLKSRRKVFGDVSDDILLRQQYEFIHLSFQEWLTGHHLLQQLVIGGETGRKALSFISQVKMEPRYLMVLKMLVGLVMGESGSDSGSLKQQFWSGVITNADGVLELDLESRVKMLMHLLEQVKSEERAYIPHFKKLEELIDEVVCGDVMGWTEHIRSSRYMSEQVSRVPLILLDRGLSNIKDTGGNDEALKIAIMILGKLAGRFSEGHEDVLNKLHQLLDEESVDWQLKKVSIRSVGEIIKVAHSVEAKGIIKRIVELVLNDNLRETVTKVIVSLIEAKRVFGDYVLKCFNQLLISAVGSRSKVARAIVDLVFETSVEFKRTAIDCLIPLLRSEEAEIRMSGGEAISYITDGDCAELREKVTDKLLPFLNDENLDIVIAVTETIGDIAERGVLPSEVRLRILDSMVPLLLNEHVHWYALSAIYRILEGGSDEVQIRAIKILTPFLQNSDKNVRESAMKVLGKVVSGNELPIAIKQEAFRLIAPLLKDSNEYVRWSAVQVLGKVVSGNELPIEVRQALFNLIAPLLKDSDWSVRQCAVQVLVQVVSGNDVPIEVRQEWFKFLIPLLNDQYVGQRAVQGLVNVVSGNDVPIKVRQEWFKFLIPLLNAGDQSVRQYAVQVLVQVVSGNDLPIKMKEEAFNLIVPLLKDSNQYVRQCAVQVLVQVVSGNDLPITMKEEAFKLIIPLLKDRSGDVRRSAVEWLGKVVSGNDVSIAMKEEVFKLILPLLNDGYRDVRRSAVQVLCQVVSGDELPIEVRQEWFKFLIPLLNDQSVRCYAVQVLGKVVSGNDVPIEIRQEWFNLIAPLLKDSDKDVRVHAVQGLGRVVSGNDVPIAMKEEAFNLFFPLLKDGDRDIRKSAMLMLASLSDGVLPSGIKLQVLEQCSSGYNPNAQEIQHLIAKVLNTGGLITKIWQRKSGYSGNISGHCTQVAQILSKADEPSSRTSKVLQELSVLLQDSREHVRQNAMLAINQIMQKQTIEQLFEIRKEATQSQKIQSCVVQSLAVKLNELSKQEADQKDIKLIFSIFEAIGQYPDEDDPDEKQFVKVSRHLISEIVGIPGNIPKAIALVEKKGIANILSMSSESVYFLRKLYQGILEDGGISEKEGRFLEECMKNGITALFKRDGSVIVNGVTYRMEDYGSRVRLEAIIERTIGSLADQNVPHYQNSAREKFMKQYLELAVQYKNNKPVFPVGTDATGAPMMTIAASDVGGEIVSVTGNGNVEYGTWYVSVMHLSTQHKTEPSDVFLILERRNAFGDHIIVKVFVDQDSHQFRSDVLRCYPGGMNIIHIAKNTPVSLEELMHGMEYRTGSKNKPRYYVTGTRLKIEEGVNLLDGITGKKVDGATSLYETMWNLLSKYGVSKQLSWTEYVRGEEIYELKKTSLFKEREPGYLLTRQQSLDVNMMESLISANLREDEEREVADIESDPYKEGFYKGLMLQLNGVYTACLSINSELISPKEEKGNLGNFGGLVKALGEGVSLFGVVGLSLIGDVMEKIDSGHHEGQMSQKIANYLKLAGNSAKMERFAEKLARKLVNALDNLNVEEEGNDHIATMLSAAGTEQADVSTSALLMVQGRIGDVLDARKAGELKSYTDYIKRFFSGGSEEVVEEEEKQRIDGEEKAKGIGKVIINTIFEGKLIGIKTVDEQVQTIVKLLGVDASISTDAQTADAAVHSTAQVITAPSTDQQDQEPQAVGGSVSEVAPHEIISDAVPNQKMREIVVQYLFEGRCGVERQLSAAKWILSARDTHSNSEGSQPGTSSNNLVTSTAMGKQLVQEARWLVVKHVLEGEHGLEEGVKTIKGVLGEESRSEPQYNNAREKLFIGSSVAYRLPGTWDRLKYVLKEAIKDDDGESYLDIDSELNTFDSVVSYWTGLEEVTSKIGNVVRPTLVLGGATASYITTNRHSELVWAMSQPEYGFAEGGMVQKSLYYLTSATTAVYFGGLAAGAIGAATAAGTTGLMTAPVLVPASMALLAGSSLMGRASVDLGLVSEDNSWVYTLNTGAGLGMEVLGLFHAPSKILKAMHGIGVTAYSVVPLQSGYSNLKSMCVTAYQGIFPPEGWVPKYKVKERLAVTGQELKKLVLSKQEKSADLITSEQEFRVIEISKSHDGVARTVKEISEMYCNNVESDKEGICKQEEGGQWIPVEELVTLQL
ncbi:NACHT domain-containing protein [Rickettsiales endosymbiont of Peranema trichophorum]|uniref:sister chromatid cohesion protein PDS5 n=1 Tax=Rickettsiales endosymbiont of Peranema trichophorum TaxID=2486577 RepID=UPI0010230A3E|nr:sister chromatid cohesion protein PDS5 [Rickettsiales endosymbiont of Peranema trichophorum]RZI45099.1 NACHT domain-containing protein [Rickettsiales endosymbiont of Peranema trichophorum]